MSMGESIKNARRAKGLTQRELAKILNVSFNSISDWENDIHKPDVDTFELLCRTLDISPSAVLNAEYSEQEVGKLAGTVISDAEMVRFLNEYYQLDDADKSAIKQIVSSLCIRKGDV